MNDNVARSPSSGSGRTWRTCRPRVTMATTVMGQGVSLPVLISPTVVQAVHPDGEVAVARAAAAAGTAMGLSSFASKPVEEVGKAIDKLLFQSYLGGQPRGQSWPGPSAPARAGAKGLIVTLDWVFDSRRDWGSPWIRRSWIFKAMLRYAPQVAIRPEYLARWNPQRAHCPTSACLTWAPVTRRSRPFSAHTAVDGISPADLGGSGLAARAVGAARS